MTQHATTANSTPRKKTLGIVLFAVVVLLSIVVIAISRLNFNNNSTVGEFISEYEAANASDTLRIKVKKHKESGGSGFAVHGSYFVFKSKTKNQKTWQDVFKFRHDDVPTIPKDSIKFISDSVAVVFMGWKCAVTSDGGKTWNVWNADGDLPDWKPANYKFIQNVSLRESGEGVMNLSPIRYKHSKLYTFDFGKNWMPTQDIKDK